MHHLVMANHKTVLAAVERYLPRAFWSKSWWHASPSCRKGSCANYGQSPAEVKNWFKTANWTFAVLKKSGCCLVWTLENTVRLLQCFLGFPKARVFRMERHCELPQKRTRLLVSNIVISIPLHEGPQLRCYDALAKSGVGRGQPLICCSAIRLLMCARARSRRSQ